MRACLRCRFLKKTCDKGEPCAGCQPTHVRLWQVPCTRVDVRDIGYFLKDWKVDYERHVSLGLSIDNIKGFGDAERVIFITHGYGEALPIKAREVFVRDESCFSMDWIETMNTPQPTQYEVETARLSAGMEGVSRTMLSEYLDHHIDGPGFLNFVENCFEGTPFLTQMLQIAYRYYQRTKIPVIRKVLKLMLAYNLTLHVTMVEGIGEEETLLGRNEDPESRYYGQTMAPLMVHFQVKLAMSHLWRELQKSVLEDMSRLYSSVYSGHKLKHWPTIFIVASVLLFVWEEMQFDSHYRVLDPASVKNFCTEMESTPVGVVVGLFHAISLKLPSFSDWDTEKHHQLLDSNPAVCETLTEVRENITKYGKPSVMWMWIRLWLIISCRDIPSQSQFGQIRP